MMLRPSEQRPYYDHPYELTTSTPASIVDIVLPPPPTFHSSRSFWSLLMMNRTWTLLACFAVVIVTGTLLAGDVASAAPVDQYNVVFDTPCKGFHGAMPLGNGDIGISAWVEQDGDLLFYIGKTDAYDENHRLLKLGRVRIKLSPNPFQAGEPFRQELKLGDGELAVAGRQGRCDGRRAGVGRRQPAGDLRRGPKQETAGSSSHVRNVADQGAEVAGRGTGLQRSHGKPALGTTSVRP